jgi:UMF1 family MFS transporter
MGYVGALLLLVFTAVGMLVFKLGDPADWRPFFVFAGIWFVLNMIPAASSHTAGAPREHARTARARSRARRSCLREGHLRSARHFRQLVRFLTAFFVYGMGVQVIIAFASIIADDFGFGSTKLVLYVLQLTVTAGASRRSRPRSSRTGSAPSPPC